MNSFLHPVFLWGLAGLSIPVAIHLLSRKEGKIIKVGSLRHLRTAESPTFKSIKINELLLLAVRCLLLALMVLFISGWMLPNWWKAENGKWVLVDPILEVDASMEKVLDSLIADGYELRSLQKGFPEIDEGNKISQDDYWALVSDLGKMHETEIIVFSGNQLNRFNGKRTSLPSNVRWASLPIPESGFYTEAIKLNAWEVQVRNAKSNSFATFFESGKKPVLPGDKYFHGGKDSVLIENPDTIVVRVFADEKYEYDKKVMMAVLEAINRATLVELDICEGKPEAQDDWVIGFSDDEQQPDSNFIFYGAEDVAPFFKQVGKSKWQITQRLNQEVASNNQLTTALFDLIIPNKNKASLKTLDKRSLPEAMLWSKDGHSADIQHAGVSSNQEVIFVLILILFLIERAMAFAKRL